MQNETICRVAVLGVVALLCGGPAAEAACSCSQMILRRGSTAGSVQSGVYCSDAGVPDGCAATGAAGTNGCPEEATPYRCPLGPIEPAGNAAGNFGWAFEIVATLTEGSSIEQCPEGQGNSATLSKNDVVQVNPMIFDNEPPGGNYDFASALQVRLVSGQVVPKYGATVQDRLELGSDDYVEPSIVKVHDPGTRTIRWVDTPLVSVSADEAWTERSQFLSFVKGSSAEAPQCWCLFTIDHSWDSGVQGEASVTLDRSHNCAIGD
jgi:hypothetical protein